MSNTTICSGVSLIVEHEKGEKIMRKEENIISGVDINDFVKQEIKILWDLILLPPRRCL
jgi:hypothetical protein